MAKATKTPAKKSGKPAPKKNGKADTHKAKAKAETPKKAEAKKPEPTRAAAKPQKAEPAPRESASKDAPVGKPNPDASSIRSHPDARLAKQELNQLYGKLVEEKSRVLSNFENRVDNALAEEDVLADEIDIAQRSTDQAWLFRMADKDRKLLIEIEAALEKMHSGEYGVCEGTDEPIGFKRLELRPWTRYSVGYKEMLEREKAQQAR